MSLIPLRSEIKKIAATYDRFTRDIYKQIFGMGNYSNGKAKRVLKNTELGVHKLNLYCTRFFKRNIPRAYRIDQIRTINIFKKIGKPQVKKIDDSKIINGLIKTTVSDCIRANSTILKKVKYVLEVMKGSEKRIVQAQFFHDKEDFYKVVDKIIDEAETVKERAFGKHTVTSTGTRQKATKEIREYFESKFGKVNFIEIIGKDGIARNYVPSKYIKMLARTKLREVQTTAQLTTCKEYNNDLVMFSTHDNPCPLCALLEGRIFSISGNSKKYPHLSGNEPPFHPNCEHSLSPWSAEVDRLTKEYLRSVA